MSMEKPIYALTAFLALLTAGLWACDATLGGDGWFTGAITAGTFLFHFVLRLAVGGLINLLAAKRDLTRLRWFRPKPWEQGLLKALRVRRWARYTPTFQKRRFDVRSQSPEGLLREMCIAEAVHEIIFAGGFLSVLFCLLTGWDYAWLFLLTALLSGLADLACALVQRQNRPRVTRLLARQQKNSVRPCGVRIPAAAGMGESVHPEE